MVQSEPLVVVGKDGLHGVIDPETNLEDNEQIRLILNRDREVWVPRDFLEPQEDGTYFIPLSLGQIDSAFAAQESGNPASSLYVLPVIAETLKIGRRRVNTGEVRVRKEVHERQEVVDEPTIREEVEVQRVPVNRVIEQLVKIRQEGDTLIVPLVEEVVVVEKRLVLREEVHITKQRRTIHDPQQVTLKHEEAIVERIDESDQPGQS